MPASRDRNEEHSSAEASSSRTESEAAASHAGTVKVSVVVPVYNPGRYIDDCIASLLRQTMPASEFEVVFVDDGSTDDTPQRLDDLAAQHHHIHVIHQENSGWPGRPRNVGIDNARGEYVMFMDNDDWLSDEALARMYAYASEHGSDILIPRYVGHGRGVARELFNANVPRTTLRQTPRVIDSMTPHKMVRRAFLAEHGLRFPEGKRRLEDHVFFIEAYLLAEVISILSDHPCYHHVNRDDHGNAARTPYDPKVYFGAVREVLDIIDEHTEPGDFRDRLYMRWYGTELMGRVDRGTFFRYPAEFQERVFDEVHKLSLERFGEHLIKRFGAARRVRAHLIRHGDLDDYRTFLRHDLRVGAKAWLTAARWTERQTLELELAGRLHHPDAALFRARDGRVAYALPGDLDSRVPESATTVTEEALAGKVRLVLHGRRSEVEYIVPLSATLAFAPSPVGDGPVEPSDGEAGQERREPGRERPEDQVPSEGRCLEFTGTAEIDPRTAATGGRLPQDVWELRVRVATCSWSEPTWVAWPEESPAEQDGDPAAGSVRIDAAGSTVRVEDMRLGLGVRGGGRRTVLRVAGWTEPPQRPTSGGWRHAARRIRRGLRRRMRRRRAKTG